MVTLPFDLKDFPFAAADGKLIGEVMPRWQKLWFRASTLALLAILVGWFTIARQGIALLFPLAVQLWFVNVILWQKTVARTREKTRQNALSSREAYTVRLDDRSIILASPSMTRSYPREVVSNILDWRGNLLIIVDALSYIAIPPKAFADAASRAAFLAAAKAMVPAQRPAT